jgi:hypothetical protein
MDMLARWLVQQPLHILLVAAAFFAAWGLVRATPLGKVPRANALRVPAFAWLAYAGWEWLVHVFSPGADIRVDLLLIWPVVGLATLWGLVRLLAAAVSR